MSMKLFYAIFILLFIHISSYCNYEGKANQNFCSKRKVDIDEVPEEFREYYPQYKCCYIYIIMGGEKGEGCVSTSPTMVKDILGCDSSTTNSDPNGNFDEDTNSISYKEYLLTKIYKIIILSLIILY